MSHSRPTCWVVRFLLNGEEEYRAVYENEDHCNKDCAAWCGTDKRNKNAFTVDIFAASLQRTPMWHELKTQCATLEDTIVQWLHGGQTREWTNVIASITSSSLADVYEAVLRADAERKLVITEQVDTEAGPVCDVRVPFAKDRVVWALLDHSEGICSDEIASITGDELSEVHAELDNLRIVEAIDILETRQTETGSIIRVRLDETERNRLLNLEWRKART